MENGGEVNILDAKILELTSPEIGKYTYSNNGLSNDETQFVTTADFMR